MASGYDWLDLTVKENQVFLLQEANELEKEVEDLRKLVIICDNQRAYIKELEKHLGLLQKTLDVANKNKVLVRKVRVSGRKKNVRKNHYR